MREQNLHDQCHYWQTWLLQTFMCVGGSDREKYRRRFHSPQLTPYTQVSFSTPDTADRRGHCSSVKYTEMSSIANLRESVV